MLKALAFTLMIATFLAAGFTLSPAEPAKKAAQALIRTETFIAENLTIVPARAEELKTTQSNATAKTDRKIIPKT
jgi:hypothetical protein